MAETRVGDTAPESGSVSLIDKEDSPSDPQGDKQKAGYVSEVEQPENLTPPVEDYKAAGYDVGNVRKGDTLSRYAADSPTPPGEVRLVDKPTTADDDLTPLERAAKAVAKADKDTKAVNRAPKNK